MKKELITNTLIAIIFVFVSVGIGGALMLIPIISHQKFNIINLLIYSITFSIYFFIFILIEPVFLENLKIIKRKNN